MHETKALLIMRNGLYCMGCGRETKLKDLQMHHLVPKYVSKANHEPPDDSYENNSLLCISCHRTIHKYLYWDIEYQMLIDLIEDNKI